MLLLLQLLLVLVLQEVCYFVSTTELIDKGDGSPVDPTNQDDDESDDQLNRENQANEFPCTLTESNKTLDKYLQSFAIPSQSSSFNCTWVYDHRLDSNQTLIVFGTCVKSINCSLSHCMITPSTKVGGQGCKKVTEKTIVNFVAPDNECYTQKDAIKTSSKIFFTMTKKSFIPFVSLNLASKCCGIDDDTTTNHAATTTPTDTIATTLSDTNKITGFPTNTITSTIKNIITPSNRQTSNMYSTTNSGNSATSNLIKILVPVIIIVVLAIVVVAFLIIYHKRKRSQNQATAQKEDKEVVENVIYSAAAPLADGSPEGVMVDNVIYGQNNYHVIDT